MNKNITQNIYRTKLAAHVTVVGFGILEN